MNMNDDVDYQGDEIWNDIDDEDVDTDNEDPDPSENNDYMVPDKQLFHRIQKLLDECVKFQLPQTRTCNRWRLNVARLMVSGRLSKPV